jgi:hypothetical protein
LKERLELALQPRMTRRCRRVGEVDAQPARPGFVHPASRAPAEADLVDRGKGNACR